MNFVQWLNSLDELLYELMSWIIFFPITLWRILRRPLTTMRYAEAQLLLDHDLQYRATVSPPIMLILSVVVMQGIGLAVDGTNPIVASRHGLAALVSDNTTLLLLRLVLFGTFALVLAARKVQRSSVSLDRDTLKPPFYAQCYAISPFCLLIGIGTVAAAEQATVLRIAGWAAWLVACVFYTVAQVRWFGSELQQPLRRSLVDVSIGLFASLAITLGVALLFR